MTRKIELTTGFESATAPTTDVDASDIDYTQGDPTDWTTADGGKFNLAMDEAGDRLTSLESLGATSYQGTWNATTNTPTLASGVGTKGYYYVVSTGGSTNLDGVSDWVANDWAIYNGTAWEKVDNTDVVTSVNGNSGVVSLDSADLNHTQNVTGDWTTADGTSIAAHLDEVGDRVTTLEGSPSVVKTLLKVSSTSGQSFNNNTATNAQFVTVAIDTQSGWDAVDEYTVQSGFAGQLLALCRISWQDDVDWTNGEVTILDLQVDTGGGYASVAKVDKRMFASGGLNQDSVELSELIVVSATDKIKIVCTQISGGAVPIQTNVSANRFTLIKIGD